MHMKKVILLLMCLISILPGFSQDNDSLHREWKKMHDSKNDRLKEYNDLKFGMFIHWGVYSKLGGVWKGIKVVPETYDEHATIGEWIMSSAKRPRDEYREVARTL